jgi:hypothetical protein
LHPSQNERLRIRSGRHAGPDENLPVSVLVFCLCGSRTTTLFDDLLGHVRNKSKRESGEAYLARLDESSRTSLNFS